MVESRTGLYIGLSFLAGVLLTLGFKDVYPDLERNYRQRKRRFSILDPRSLQVRLRDNTRSSVARPGAQIPEGIEACIGHTPLIKIKSLSDETGCEILAKAEVCSRLYQVEHRVLT